MKKLLKLYAIAMVIIILILFIRYIIVYNENFLKYLAGIHLWEMGYDFSKSFNTHAPALNMHMSFVSIVSLFLLLNQSKQKIKTLVLYSLLFVASFSIILYINTRVSLITSIVGYAIVFFYEIFKKDSPKKILRKATILFAFVVLSGFIFTQLFPHTIKKFTKVSFANMDMVGRLDEFENPESKVYNSLVTRVTIWKTALELSKSNMLVGYGASDSKSELIAYYKETDQRFLTKYEFPVHNQYIDFLLKFGILGLLVVFMYLAGIGYLGYKLRHPIPVAFCVLFLISNLTDDFLILYSGIAFSGFWFSIFASEYLKKKTLE